MGTIFICYSLHHVCCVADFDLAKILDGHVRGKDFNSDVWDHEIKVQFFPTRYLDLHKMLGTSKTYSPKWWFDGDFPWHKVKHHLKTNPRICKPQKSLKVSLLDVLQEEDGTGIAGRFVQNP